MVQLGSKVMFTCIPDVSCTHFKHVLRAFWQKGHGSYVSLAAALLQGFAFSQTYLVHILCVSYRLYMRPTCTHFRCVSHAFQMRLTCISDACEFYFGAELYHSYHLYCNIIILLLCRIISRQLYI